MNNDNNKYLIFSCFNTQNESEFSFSNDIEDVAIRRQIMWGVMFNYVKHSCYLAILKYQKISAATDRT